MVSKAPGPCRTAEYRLGVAERGSRVSYGYGMWNTHRTLALIAPPRQSEGAFAGFEYFTTDGYGENRAAKRALGFGRFSGDLKKKELRVRPQPLWIFRAVR